MDLSSSDKKEDAAIRNASWSRDNTGAMFMIESIEFKNFKVLRDTVLPLGRFTLIVGPNGSGKSTALQAFGTIRDFGAHSFSTLASAGVQPSPYAAVSIRLRWGEPYNLFCEGSWTPTSSQPIKWGSDNGTSLREKAQTEFQAITTYALDPNKIMSPVELLPKMQLNPAGDNLAGILDQLQDTDPERFETINRELQRMLPEFDRILFTTPAKGTKAFALRTALGKHRIPARDLSQGTLLAVALLTIAFASNEPTLIGLEEPDRGIHPRLLRDLRDAIYRLCYPEQFGETRPPVQVVATTQSPYFLDLFTEHPEEIVIAEKMGLEAKFHRLLDRPDMPEILGDAPLGEVWYSGVLGGMPARS
jgi:predicted ATPase